MKNKVLVAGCGISGIGAARMLLAAGKSVILYDGNDKKDLRIKGEYSNG